MTMAFAHFCSLEESRRVCKCSVLALVCKWLSALSCERAVGKGHAGFRVIPCQINAKKYDPSRLSSNFVSIRYLWSNSASPSFKLIRQVLLDLWLLKCHNFYDILVK